MNGDALRVVEGTGVVADVADSDAPNLGLDRVQNIFGQLALEASPWFGGVVVENPDFLRNEVDPHPRFMDPILAALDGRNPRWKIRGQKLKITFDLIGPHEVEQVDLLTRDLARIFGGVADFQILHDADEPFPDATAVTHGAEVVLLFQTDAVDDVSRS